METRNIKAVFGASKSIVAPKRYKHDYGQEIEFVGIDLPDVFEAHFSNSKSGQAKKQIGQGNVVTVPDEYFVSGADVFCWVVVHDEATDGRTMYTVRIPVMERPEPINAEPTPVQQDVIAQVITALNEAVAQTAQDVESADASAQSASDSADRAESARDTAEGYAEDAQTSASNASASAQSAASSATSSASSASQAQQMKVDVQGLVSDAQSAAGESAQSALESAQSATQASASATAAGQSASTASTKASEASASAQTASAKATEASGYASNASTKASEASQSASAASGYATQAGQAKTAAETAQGLAEQAQSDAEQIKSDVQDIADGIDTRLTDLEADKYKAYVTDTATGAIASFPDGADDVPMKDVTVQIEPAQDLHGYDNPWPAGGGKNLLPIILSGSTYGTEVYDSDGNIVAVKFSKPLTESTQTRQICQWMMLAAGSYILSQEGLTAGSSIGLRAKDGSISKNVTSSAPTVAITLSEDKEVRVIVNLPTDAVDFTLKPMLRLASETDDSYAPYSNICPITGWTGVNVNHGGADMSDTTLYSITFPTEAGTVYGGTLDVTTGELVVDRAMVDLGTLNWQLFNVSQGSLFRSNSVNINANILYNSTNFICSNYQTVIPVYRKNGTITCSVKNNVDIIDNGYSDATTFKTAMSGVQLVYELKTPQTYQLTSTEICSLLGRNYIFADTGDSTVEYRADTKLYISKKITEAVSALS